MSPKNFYMFWIPFGVSQFNTPFIFSSFILIHSSPITTPKNSTSLTFYLYFFDFIYKLFSANLFTTSFTTSLFLSSSFIPTIILSIKLTTSPVLIKFWRIFIYYIKHDGSLCLQEELCMKYQYPNLFMQLPNTKNY